jgi:hypothetical protein
MRSEKTLPKLEEEVKSLGLYVKPTGKNGKFMKRDYVMALMQHHILMLYGSIDKVPINLKFRLSFESPQLAYNYFDLKPKEQENIWVSENVWLVEKIQGIRGTLIQSIREGWSCYSRDINEKTYIWDNYSERVLDHSIGKLDKNIVVDVELQLANKNVKPLLKEMNFEIETDFQCISALMMIDSDKFNVIAKQCPNLFLYKLIDVYFYETDVRKKAYKEREELFDKIVTELKSVGVLIERPLYCKDPLTKKAFHEGLIKQGAEGTIAVFIDKPCILDGTRGRDEMIKIKKSLFSLMFEKNALTDTVDGWVSKVINSDELTGLVRTIEVSALDNKGAVVVIAVTDAIPLSCRLFSQTGDSTPRNISEGDVIELSGSVWKEGLIQDATVERIRWDKMPHACTLNG